MEVAAPTASVTAAVTDEDSTDLLLLNRMKPMTKHTILPFCNIKVMTIGIGRNELPIFVIVLPIPIQYCNINNPAVLCLFCP